MIQNLRRKEYNPCGNLTGKEREICDEATKNYFNLPFVEVMRIISVKTFSELENKKNFQNLDAIKNWANFNQNIDEQHANLDFNTFSTFQKGLAKYLTHILYENRYNIHYNALINYFCTLEIKFSADDALEKKINSLAQSANCSTTINALKDEFLNFLGFRLAFSKIIC